MIVITIDGVEIKVLEHSVSRTSRGISAYFEAEFPAEQHVRCIGLYDDPFVVQDISPDAIPQLFEGVYLNEILQASGWEDVIREPPSDDGTLPDEGLILVNGISMEDVAYFLLELAESPTNIQ